MNLEIPVAGVTRGLRDSFLDSRGRRRKHRPYLALDIGSTRGTPILAVTGGEIVRIGREKRGGNAIYLRDSSNRYLFYCHLSHYAHLLARPRSRRVSSSGWSEPREMRTARTSTFPSHACRTTPPTFAGVWR